MPFFRHLIVIFASKLPLLTFFEPILWYVGDVFNYWRVVCILSLPTTSSDVEFIKITSFHHLRISFLRVYGPMSSAQLEFGIFALARLGLLTMMSISNFSYQSYLKLVGLVTASHVPRRMLSRGNFLGRVFRNMSVLYSALAFISF